ncbi:MAG: Asp-tRNA(Asn)/Glu-tRNA(Gln) amidotransferase subunit GatC [Nitrospirae bacterium]|nr:MAG: Asp-tRNA(Asn)/Glu-tRNA(Gln) amidotransferase subunit GatC [Nitrospirota bacterium]
MEFDVEKVAQLAMLGLNEEEKELYGKQLGDIIKFMNKLNELNTEDVEPTSHVVDINNVFREDEPKESLPREEVLKNAPDKEDGFFKVPRIIE